MLPENFWLKLVSLVAIFTLATARVNNPEKSSSVPLNEMTQEGKIAVMMQMYRKIDSNENAVIDTDELKVWIDLVHNRTSEHAVKFRFNFLDRDGNGQVSWWEFRSLTFSVISDDENEGPDPKNYTQEQFRDLEKAFKADRARFQVIQLSELLVIGQSTVCFIQDFHATDNAADHCNNKAKANEQIKR